LIELDANAVEQVFALRAAYESKGRLEAVRNLIAAITQAAQRIERDPGHGLPAPRPYPELARAGERWTKAGRYWIAYSVTKPPVILGVFYDASDTLGRK
jgi:hypothetical protein